MKFYWSNRIGSLLLSLVLTLVIVVMIMNFEIVFLFENEAVRSTVINIFFFIVLVVTAFYGYLVALGFCKLTITEDEIIYTKFIFDHVIMKRDNIKYVEINEVQSFITTKKIVGVYGKNNENLFLPHFGKNAETIKKILDKPLTTAYYID